MYAKNNKDGSVILWGVGMKRILLLMSMIALLIGKGFAESTMDLFSRLEGKRFLIKQKGTNSYFSYDPDDARKIVLVDKASKAGRFLVSQKDEKIFIDATIKLDGEWRRRLNADGKKGELPYFRNKNQGGGEAFIWENETFKNTKHKRYMYISGDRVKLTKDGNIAVKLEFVLEEDLSSSDAPTTNDIYERLKGKEFFIKTTSGYLRHAHEHSDKKEREEIRADAPSSDAARFTMNMKDDFIFITATEKVGGEDGRRMQQSNASDKNPDGTIRFHNKNMDKHERWKIVDGKYLQQATSSWFLGIRDGRLHGYESRANAVPFRFVEDEGVAESIDALTTANTPGTLELYEELKGKEFMISTQVDGKRKWFNHAGELLVLGSVKNLALFTMEHKVVDGKSFIFLRAKKKVDDEAGRTLQQKNASTDIPHEKVSFVNKNKQQWESWQIVGGKYLMQGYSGWYLGYKGNQVIASKDLLNMPLEFEVDNKVQLVKKPMPVKKPISVKKSSSFGGLFKDRMFDYSLKAKAAKKTNVPEGYRFIKNNNDIRYGDLVKISSSMFAKFLHAPGGDYGHDGSSGGEQINLLWKNNDYFETIEDASWWELLTENMEEMAGKPVTSQESVQLKLFGSESVLGLNTEALPPVTKNGVEVSLYSAENKNTFWRARGKKAKVENIRVPKAGDKKGAEVKQDDVSTTLFLLQEDLSGLYLAPGRAYNFGTDGEPNEQIEVLAQEDPAKWIIRFVARKTTEDAAMAKESIKDTVDQVKSEIAAELEDDDELIVPEHFSEKVGGLFAHVAVGFVNDRIEMWGVNKMRDQIFMMRTGDMTQQFEPIPMRLATSGMMTAKAPVLDAVTSITMSKMGTVYVIASGQLYRCNRGEEDKLADIKWEPVSTGTYKLRSFATQDDELMWCVDHKGFVREKVGDTWTARSGEGVGAQVSVGYDRTVFAINSMGMLFEYNSENEQWSELTSDGKSLSLKDITHVDRDHIYGVTKDDQAIFYSYDAGKATILLSSDDKENQEFNRVALDGKTVVLVSEKGALFTAELEDLSSAPIVNSVEGSGLEEESLVEEEGEEVDTRVSSARVRVARSSRSRRDTSRGYDPRQRRRIYGASHAKPVDDEVEEAAVEPAATQMSIDERRAARLAGRQSGESRWRGQYQGRSRTRSR